MKQESRWILPINENPSIITCIHYAYPCAIIESKELARINVNNYSASSWEIRTNDTSVAVADELLTICEAGKKDDTNTVIWRKCDDADEVIINMKYVRPCDTGRYIDVFIFSDDMDFEVNAEDKTCGVRWNPYGYFIQKEMYNFDTKIYKYLKVSVGDGNIVGYASKDGIDWIYVAQKEIPESMKENMNIGIHVYSGKDYYTLWRNMNFIQLIYNPDNPWKGIYLDYYFFPRKNVDNSYMYFPNFLETHYDTTYDALDCFDSLHDYIKWNLNHLYYPEICLDEYYVPQRLNYGVERYDHYNLFYGYDDAKEVYYIMGYSKDNKPIVSELPYELLKEEIVMSEKIIRYKYASNDNTNLRFNITPVKNSLKELLHSIDSSEKVSNLLTQEPLLYGLSIFKHLATDKVARKRITRDRRVSFCLLEHSKLMKERIEFLFENGYIDESALNELIKLSDEIIRDASIIMGFYIKGSIRLKMYEEIYDYLLKMHDLEKELCEKLLSYLG